MSRACPVDPRVHLVAEVANRRDSAPDGLGTHRDTAVADWLNRQRESSPLLAWNREGIECSFECCISPK
jgi:hypothetical protein